MGWMEVIPADITAEIVSKTFYKHWICRFGVLYIIITDQGTQFQSQLFRSLAVICEAKVLHAIAYHSQCDGKIERLHRNLKIAIKEHDNSQWTETLPTVLLCLRSALRCDTNHSIAQMVYGTNFKLPDEFFDPPNFKVDPATFAGKLLNYMDNFKPIKTRCATHQKVFIQKDLKSCSYVFVRTDKVKKPREPTYTRPFQVSDRNEKYFSVLVKGKTVNISVCRLKPAYMLATDFDAVSDKVIVDNKSNQHSSEKISQAIDDSKTLTAVPVDR
ncbi:uncharacterized protein LOC118195390 [Stegodyphus dumicola]|uniref:uncharacterized protein LOC118195390 n=1 Tax=Stegodyphus dumicola TaxID=202533 RepID=UPI0015AEEF6A|nr:uncharacterized protein LOC118195390 [Stegodyphus dumicola]